MTEEEKEDEKIVFIWFVFILSILWIGYHFFN